VSTSIRHVVAYAERKCRYEGILICWLSSQLRGHTACTTSCLVTPTCPHDRGPSFGRRASDASPWWVLNHTPCVWPRGARGRVRRGGNRQGADALDRRPQLAAALAQVHRANARSLVPCSTASRVTSRSLPRGFSRSCFSSDYFSRRERVSLDAPEVDRRLFTAGLA